ncbi:facilitated trehalose transporter Tret1-like isoform X2 [Lycorma delicatula]|uniref:facilitated trehalose transporter Tret1-like isoform X2 n=1 Tax=Lycorma delicatula TaxID=130591 RepID=UPI003F510468
MAVNFSSRSIIYASHPFATLISGFCQDTFGRKRVLHAVNIPIFIGWILIYFSSSVVYLNCAAILLGLSLGFIEAPALSYIGEISEPHLRGVMCLSTGIFGSIGTLLESLIGALTDWRSTCAISATFAVAAIIALTLIPESPVWLITKNRTSEAEKALCWLRGWVNPTKVREEFLAMQEHTKLSSTKKNENDTRPSNNKETIIYEKHGIIKKIKVLTKPGVYRPLRMLMICFMISDSVSLRSIRPFLINIFKLIGTPLNPYWVLVMTGVLSMAGCFSGMLCIRLFGKKQVYFTSILMCVVCCYIIGICLMIGNISPWVPFTCFSIIFFAAGFGVLPLPWSLISEVFPLEGRGVASGVAGALSYLLMFIVTKTYVNLSTWFHLHGSLFIYGTIGLIGLPYVYFYFPETEGKTLHEIEDIFKDKKTEKK